MRWSNLFIPTLRDDPASAEAASHRLLLRAGYIRQLGAGIYSLLPLAQKVRRKVIGIIREEMSAIGAQEFLLPALHPDELWKESGRWEIMGDNMFRLKDRKGASLALGVTHEEVFTSIARDALSSYRQLPQIWYQFQTKFRDEPRPKSGLLRVREFTMKDSYSFDVDREGLDAAFDAHHRAYCKIFERLGLEYFGVDASSGAMGGSRSTEFMARTEAGEDNILKCSACDYAANVEKAASSVGNSAAMVASRAEVPGGETAASPAAGRAPRPGENPPSLEKFATPGVRTIEQLTTFPGGAGAGRQIKTLIYAVDEPDKKPKLLMLLLRGDHELNVTKLTEVTGASDIRPAQESEIFDALAAHPGSLGGVNVQSGAAAKIAEIIADETLRGCANMVTGANQDDFHYRGVSIDRDMSVDRFADLRTAKDGEPCIKCGAPLTSFKGLEIGHIFKLGTRYSETMGATVLMADGSKVPILMGSYGIGVERLMSAVIELSNDKNGIIWPPAIAPFLVIITPTNMSDTAIASTAEQLYKELSAAGIEVLLDDRDERPGVKFNDADLIGVPYRITIGKKVSDGIVELFNRKTRTASDVAAGDVCKVVSCSVSIPHAEGSLH